MKKYFLLAIFILVISLKAQTISDNDRTAILHVIKQQCISWNNGDLDGYMKGYWKSDSTRFIGKSGINYGWNATLESYRRGYPNKEAMGKLILKVISFESLNKNSVFVIGKWDLDRKEKVGGYFTLIWKKINGEWFITTDHSS